ncbi:MAG: hypothetical protein QOE47_1878, partial [Pyrinomonadaceae bacterium]|nr:hypothetical protein [Pyrinomonadaceae bacterium]
DATTVGVGVGDTAVTAGFGVASAFGSLLRAAPVCAKPSASTVNNNATLKQTAHAETKNLFITSSLAARHPSLVIYHSSIAARHLSLVTCHSPPSFSSSRRTIIWWSSSMSVSCAPTLRKRTTPRRSIKTATGIVVTP